MHEYLSFEALEAEELEAVAQLVRQVNSYPASLRCFDELRGASMRLLEERGMHGKRGLIKRDVYACENSGCYISMDRVRTPVMDIFKIKYRNASEDVRLKLAGKRGCQTLCEWKESPLGAKITSVLAGGFFSGLLSYEPWAVVVGDEGDKNTYVL